MATKKTVKTVKKTASKKVKAKAKTEKTPVISEKLDMPKEVKEIKIKDEKRPLG